MRSIRCLHLVVVILSALACAGAHASSKAPQAKTPPGRVPALAVSSILPGNQVMPFAADLKKEVIGPGAGHLRGTVFLNSGAERAALAGRSWTGRRMDAKCSGASVIVAVADSPEEAERIAKTEATRYAAIFEDISKRTPDARFSDQVWYHDPSGKSIKWKPSPARQLLFELDTRAVVPRGCIVFTRANVAVRIDLARCDGFRPPELFALGARVARLIDRAAGLAAPATTAKPKRSTKSPKPSRAGDPKRP